MNMFSVLVVGPSTTKSKGGMATAIQGIKDSQILKKNFKIDIFESYIDGRKIIRFFFSIYAFLTFYFTKRGYDIYHIHVASRGSTFRKGYYVRAAKRWGRKVILHIHGAQFIEFYNESTLKQKKKIINILTSADMVIALSDDWKKKFEDLFGLTNCEVLNNGVDFTKFAEAVTTPEMFKNSFLMLGRLGKRKGTYDLIDAVDIAVKQNPNLKVYLAGDGDITKVRAVVASKGLVSNIEVVGWANDDKKIELLKKVSTVVLPSYNEGLPMSILEGMASGKAIISTTVGAIPEIIKKENGILIEPGDVLALAQSMLLCADNMVMLASMCSANIVKVKNEFSINLMYEKLSEYYNKV